MIAAVVNIINTYFASWWVNPVEILPINAFGMVIFSHILSLISSPESACAMAFTTVTISVLTVRFRLSNLSDSGKEEFSDELVDVNVLLVTLLADV